MRDRAKYNTRMRVYMQGYRKTQRERIDEVLTATSELITRLKESNLLEKADLNEDTAKPISVKEARGMP